MAYEYMMDYGAGEETEEERRKRLEAEAAAAREAALAPDNIDVGGGFNPAAGGGGGFMDALGTYAQRRFDRAVEPFTNPTAALNRRMGMTPEDAANTEVQTQTVKTYGDGSQEEVTKRQIPAAGAAPAVAAPVNPAEMGAAPQPTAQPQQAQRSPEEIAKNAQALREMAQGRAAPTAQQAPAGFTPEAQAQAVEQVQQQIQQIPKPSDAGVRVAGPAVPGAMPAQAPAAAPTPVAPATTVTGAPQVGAPQTAPSLAQAGAQAQATPAPAPAAAPAQPAWIEEANAAGNDFDKLMDVAVKYPESRGAIKSKLQGSSENNRKAKEAEDIVKAAQDGDLKAWNKIQQELKPQRGKQKEEVTVGDYVRAFMYARLGLTELSQQVQNKIAGNDTEFGQVKLGNSMWRVERNRKTGEILRAQDDEGTPATQSTLNKLAAAGMKTGGQVFGFTGEAATIPPGQPDAGQEYRQRTNSQTGDVENIITTGPNRNKIYEGPPGLAKRVATSAAIAQDKEDIQTVAAFSRMNAQARLNAYENTNKRRADRMLPLLSLEEMGLRPDGSLISEQVRRPGTGVETTPPPAAATTPPAAATTPPAAATTPPAATTLAPVKPPAVATTPPAATTPLVSTQGPVAGGGGGGGTSTGGIPTAYQMEQAGKEGDLERSVREAQIKDRNKANQDFSDSLAKSRQSAAAQSSTIDRLQASIDRNPEFWGIDTNSTLWRAYVDVNSSDANKAEALNTLARNLNIPKEKRAQFDQTMNDYRNLQISAVTNSGLTASQTNTERESQRVMNTIGGISDRPAAAKATLEYAKAKIAYTDAKARAWADARRTNPGIDQLAFEANFDATTGEKIFKDANERMNKILNQAPARKLTREDTQALEWARNNPSDPRAAEIKKRLGL